MADETLLIVGDFNIHINAMDDFDAIIFQDLLESFSLQQHVSSPTHSSGHTLDLFITRQTDRIIRIPPYTDRYLSDHASILCDIQFDKPSLTVKSVTYRKWKLVNVSSLNHDIAMSDLCANPSNDLDGLVACYNNTLKALFDKHAPPKTRTITVRPRVPWLNEQLRKAKRERRNAERKWRVSKSDVDFVNFKGKLNIEPVQNIIRVH